MQCLRNLAKALLLQKDAQGNNLDRIETTVTKAKTLQGFIERVITYGKRGTLHHRRLAFATLSDKHAVHRVFEDLAKRYATRAGGYTRVLHTRRRVGDGAEMAIIELVDRVETPVASAPADQAAAPTA